MKKAIYLLTILFLLSRVPCQAQVWTEMGGHNGGLSLTYYINIVSGDASGHIYAAGSFAYSLGKQYVAQYNGSSWTELGGLGALHANSGIYGLCTDPAGNVYAAGDFADSVSYLYVAKYDGTRWSELGGLGTLAANNHINSICNDPSGNIYAAGKFTNDSARYYVAKYDGISWSELGGLNALAARGYINCVYSDASGNVYAAGYFRNDSTKYYVAKYDGSTWSELGGMNSLAANAFINTICSDPAGNIYAAGQFTDSASSLAGQCYVAGYDGTGWSNLGQVYTEKTHAGIYSICSDASGYIYAGGGFTNDTTPARSVEYVSRYDGSSWSPLGGFYGLAAKGGINCVYTDVYRNVYAAGAFKDSTGKYYVAEYTTPTGINEISNMGAISLWPNPANNTCTISVSADITGATIVIRDLVGQIVMQKTAQSGSKFTLDISGQPEGMYLVEVSQNEKNWAGKLVKLD